MILTGGVKQQELIIPFLVQLWCNNYIHLVQTTTIFYFTSVTTPLFLGCTKSRAGRKKLLSEGVHVHSPPLNSCGQDEDSLAFTSVPVPSELTVKQSSIPGAGLGVFAKTLLHQEIWYGPYKGRSILRDAIRSDADMSYMWEVRVTVVTLIQS